MHRGPLVGSSGAGVLASPRFILKNTVGSHFVSLPPTWRSWTDRGTFFWQRKWGVATFFFRVKFVAETFYFPRLFFLSLARSLSAVETVAVRSQWERRRRAFQHAASPPVSTFCCSSPTSFWLTLDASRHISVMRSPTCWLVVVLWVPIGDNGEREYDVSSCQLFVFITLFLKCFSLKNSPNFSTWRVRGGGVKPKMTTRSSNVDTSSHFVFTYNRRKNECWCVFKGLCIWWWWRRLF